jgi:hypothetical protein
MRLVLILFLTCIGASALICGVIMISNPGGDALGLTVSLLGPTPFKNYSVPGIILTAIGAFNMTALYMNLYNRARSYNWAIAAGLIISGWIVGQVIIIEAANWLHFLYLGLGVLVTLMAWQLKGKAMI